MSEALTVLNNNEALQRGGLGMEASIFQFAKPDSLELVQKATHQDGAKPGLFRVTSTNEHYESLHVAFLASPVEQREMYKKSSTFSSENKICFSTDFLKPHDKAKEPQAMVCASCPQQSWEKYNAARKAGKGKMECRELMPACRSYWRLFLVDRLTKLPYFLSIKGANIQTFKFGMQNFMRTYAMMQANVKAENAKIEVANKSLAEGVSPLPLKPLPNVFDISFKLYVIPPQTGSGDVNFIIGFKEFAPIKESDREEFGNIYLEFVNRRRSGQVIKEPAETEDEVIAAPAPTPAVVIPATDTTTVTAPVEGQITI